VGYADFCSEVTRQSCLRSCVPGGGTRHTRAVCSALLSRHEALDSISLCASFSWGRSVTIRVVFSCSRCIPCFALALITHSIASCGEVYLLYAPGDRAAVTVNVALSDDSSHSGGRSAEEPLLLGCACWTGTDGCASVLCLKSAPAGFLASHAHPVHARSKVSPTLGRITGYLLSWMAV